MNSVGVQTCINTQTHFHPFPCNYSSIHSQAFCPHADAHSRSLLFHAPRECNEGSGGSTGRLLWAVAIQMLPGGAALSCVCSWLRASCDGQLPTLPRHWLLPRWLTQIEVPREERNARNRSLSDAHAHSEVHLRGHPSHRDACVVPSEQVKLESFSYFWHDLKLSRCSKVPLQSDSLLLKVVLRSSYLICEEFVLVSSSLAPVFPLEDNCCCHSEDFLRLPTQCQVHSQKERFPRETCTRTLNRCFQRDDLWSTAVTFDILEIVKLKVLGSICLKSQTAVHQP